MSKYIILGLGSIGRRHLANLRDLRPEAEIVTVDPRVMSGIPWDYVDWEKALSENTDAAGVIIASSTEWHARQLFAAWSLRMACLCEKPIGTPQDLGLLGRWVYSPEWKCAVGFQYRYHPIWEVVALGSIRPLTEVSFVAHDNLHGRYVDVEEAMAQHPVDTAIRLLGIVTRRLERQGDRQKIYLRLEHERGESVHQLDMTRGPRTSAMTIGSLRFDLYPNDEMYRAELAAWLDWIETGQHDGRLARLADGLAVMEALYG